ncbi:oxidoreductase [Chromatiales bacterium (ex Bugula neritina AB1)]|nr:oxidoreductase [Chromatiales bacterium (ex Bugula neritina AB1)]
MNLTGKTAIVTGGGRDIGRATALRLAKAGANVAINYHSSADGATSAVAEIEAQGGAAFALQGDMTSEAEVAKLVSATMDKFGSVDVLAHVTGGLVARKPLPELTIEHWQTVMDLNATSFLHLVRAALPNMVNGGSIVVTASQAGRDGGGPGAIAYAASKGAVVTMVRGMAKELGPNIRVNSVCPGMIDTDFHNTFTKPEVRKNVANATPLKREGTSEDVANLMCYLASDEAAFVTGANLDINGGTLFS